MDLGLRESCALVTGSSSSVGQAAAVAFGAEGARVTVTYHANRQRAEETADQVKNAGGQALVLQYDLADAGSIRPAIESIRREWGALNVLVNNAADMEGANPSRQPFEDVPPEDWQSMLRSTLEGVTLTVQCALPLLRQSGRGRIVNISSDVADRMPWPGLGAYSTARATITLARRNTSSDAFRTPISFAAIKSSSFSQKAMRPLCAIWPNYEMAADSGTQSIFALTGIR